MFNAKNGRFYIYVLFSLKDRGFYIGNTESQKPNYSSLPGLSHCY